MNVDSLSVETEILQSRLAVQLLKERHIVASRRMKKVSSIIQYVSRILLITMHFLAN